MTDQTRSNPDATPTTEGEREQRERDCDMQKEPPRQTHASGSGKDKAGHERPRSQGSSRGCLIAVLCVIGGIGGLAVLVGIVLISLVFSTEWLQDGENGREFRETVVTDTKSRQKIAVVNVKGMIVSQDKLKAASSGTIKKQLERAKKAPRVAAVVLDMNTPGGEVTASDEIYRAVKRVQAAGKPVITCMHGMGASGGYLIAAGSEHIVANRLTLTGSIGVIMGTLNYSEFLDEHHLKMEIYKSGEMKDALNGARDRRPEEKKYINSLVDKTFKEFARIVAENRADYEDWKEVKNAEIGDGRVLLGENAKDLGLVDECGSFRDAVEKARDLGNAPNANVVRYKPKVGLTDFLFSVRSQIANGARSILPPEQRMLEPGHLYYLLPTVVE